jgi:glycosyltransferase involved in cell wall biosynthesis
MSCELPIAAFAVPGIVNLIETEESGLLSEQDSLLLRKNIQRLLGDPELSSRLGSNARHNILENFSFEKLFQKEINNYVKLINI